MKFSLRKRFPSTPIILMSLFIAAIGVGCGGGGGGAPTFTIGGTVSGLTGTGFVLQNNGGNDLAVSADGGFTFTTGLTTNSTYNVSIQTQPTNQTCTVTSGSGTVASSNISTVSISCTLKDQDASGLYDGSGTVAFTKVQSGINIILKDVKGIVTKKSNGNIRFMFFNIDPNADKAGAGGQDANVLVDGTITSITKSDLIGTASIYRAGELVSNNVAVTGTVTTRSQISLTLALAKSTVTNPLKTSGDFKGGSMTATFNTGYDTGASTGRIETNTRIGKLTWGSQFTSITDIYLIYTAAFANRLSVTPTVTAGQTTIEYRNVIGGNLIGGNTNNMTCVVNSAVSIPNSKINIYNLMKSSTVKLDASCPGPALGGTKDYSGFAAVLDGTNTSDTLWLARTNGQYAMYAVLTR